MRHRAGAAFMTRRGDRNRRRATHSYVNGVSLAPAARRRQRRGMGELSSNRARRAGAARLKLEAGFLGDKTE